MSSQSFRITYGAPKSSIVASRTDDKTLRYYEVCETSQRRVYDYQCHFNNLSTEMLHAILHLLSFQDFPNVTRVCKLWNEAMNDHQLWKQWCEQDKIHPIFLEEMDHGKQAYQGYRLDSNWIKGKYKEYTPSFEKEEIISIKWEGNNGVLLTWDKKVDGRKYTIWRLNKEIKVLITDKMIELNGCSSTHGFGVDNQVFYNFSEKSSYDPISRHHFYSINIRCLDNAPAIPYAKLLHQNPITDIAIGEKKLATRDQTGIYIWSRDNYKLMQYFPTELGKHNESFYLKHNFLIFRQDKEPLQIWNLTTFKLKFFITGQDVLGISKKLIITKQDSSIQFWSLETGKVIHKFDLDKHYLCSSCNYEKFGLGSQDGRVVIWDLSNVNMVFNQKLEETGIVCLQLLPNWKFATGSEKGQVKVWAIDGTLLHTPQSNTWRGAVQQLVGNNDRLLALFKNKTLKIWTFDNSKRSHYESTYTEWRHMPPPREEDDSRIWSD